MENPFRFADEKYLLGLILIPVLILIYIGMRALWHSRLQKWGDPGLLTRLTADSSPVRRAIKFSLALLALAAAIIAIARPQYGTKLAEVKRKGIELIIALDVSNSMLAEDIRPNRLENAKMAINRLIERLENDKIGLIVFAGDAYVQMPITADFTAAKLFLNSINTQIVPRQGTSVGSAVRLAMRSFTPESDRSRAIIVITDGEDHEEGAIEASKEAAESGMVVHTIGIGSPQGVPIPVRGSGGQMDFRTDNDGNVIISKLNEDLLREVATAAGGIYIRATTSRTGLNDILDEINKMEKQEISAKVYSDYDEQFVYYAGLALVLLVIGYFVMDRKNRFFINLGFLGGTSQK